MHRGSVENGEMNARSPEPEQNRENGFQIARSESGCQREHAASEQEKVAAGKELYRAVDVNGQRRLVLFQCSRKNTEGKKCVEFPAPTAGDLRENGLQGVILAGEVNW